jgi:hypothetical protein
VWSVPNESDDSATAESNGEATGAHGNGEETRIESDGGGSGPSRVAFGELRGVTDDVATVALDEEDVDRLTGADEFRIVTLPADPRVDREFASLLRHADETMSVTTVRSGATLDGRLVSDVETTVVAIRPADTAIDAIPARSRELSAGDTLYVVGRPEVLRRVEQQATSHGNQTDGGEDEDDGSGGDSEDSAPRTEPTDGTPGAQSS